MQKRILKGLVLTAVGLYAANAFAVAEGFYLGLMMGPASNGATETNIQVLPLPTPTARTANIAPASPSSNQFGSRLFFGYKFNPYAGFEGGFTYFSGITYKLRGDTFTAAAGTTARVRSIDFVGKLDYTYSNTIGFYGKGGVAAVYTTTPGALNITNYRTSADGTRVYQSGSNTYTVKFSPTFSIGASYDWTPNWQTDISWTRIFTGGSVSYMDFYALGLSYHFVNLYCGQFLCD